MKLLAARSGGGRSDGSSTIACWQKRGCRSSSRTVIASRSRMSISNAAEVNASLASPCFHEAAPHPFQGQQTFLASQRLLFPGRQISLLSTSLTLEVPKASTKHSWWRPFGSCPREHISELSWTGVLVLNVL